MNKDDKKILVIIFIAAIIILALFISSIGNDERKDQKEYFSNYPTSESRSSY